jgi:hypothetical protein
MPRVTKLPIDVSDLSLQPNELKFVGTYCTESNMDEVIAYKKAFPHRVKGLSYSEVRLASLELLNKREIKLAIKRFTDSVLGPWQDKLSHQLLSVLRTRAFFDVSDFFHEDGSPKRLSEIPEELRVVIDGVSQDAKGKNADVFVTMFKLGDRVTAMKMLQELLKKKEEIDENAQEMPSEARQRIRDVFAGLEKGLSIANRIKKSAEHEQEMAQIEHNTDDVVDVAVTYDPEIETAPVVKAAKKLANMELSGVGVEKHPEVERARDIVRKMRGR